jgi:hypothetical protein
MAASAFRFVGGGSISCECRDSDRKRQREDNKQHNQFSESHEFLLRVFGIGLQRTRAQKNRKL